MASFTERLAYIITANGRDAIKTFKDVSASATTNLGATEGAIGGLGAKAKGVGAGLKGFAGGLAASFGIGMADQVADAASQMEQSVGAIESIFGSAMGTIEDFGETAAQTAGLSKREVNELAAVMGAQLKGMGFSADEAADKVVILQKRAADMAATFGGTTSDAVLALSSSLRGEHERIERYGVSLRQSEIDARASAMGLDMSTTAAAKHGRALATLQVLLDGTSATQGQFAREQDTAAGALSRYHAELENLQITLGEGLLPLLSAVADGLGTVTQAAQKVTGPFGGISGVLKGVVKNLPGIREISTVSDIFGNNAEDAEPKVKHLGDATGGLGDEADGAADDVIKLVDATTAYKDAIDGTLGANLDSRDAARALSDAEDDLAEALGRGGTKAEEAEKKTRTYQDALEDVLGDALDVGDAHDSAAEAVERLAEALGQGSENAADFRERLSRGEQTVDGYAEAVRRAARDAVRAASGEVDAMAESGEIADTAGARKAALADRLNELKRDFPAVAGEIEGYLAKLRQVPNLATESQVAEKKSADSKRDLGEATDNLIEKARLEAEGQDTVIGKYSTLLARLEDLKTRYPEVAGVIQQAINDTNAAITAFWNDPRNNSWGSAMTRESMAGRGGGRLGDYGGLAGAARDAAVKPTVTNNTTVNVKVDGTGLTPQAAADYIGQRVAWAVTSARK